MAFGKLGIGAIRRANDNLFHDMLGIIPSGLTKSERDKYPLKDLQYANLPSRPSDPARFAAKALRKAYYTGGFFLNDPSALLVNPGDKTMDDLAKFCQKNHTMIFEIPEDGENS